MTPMQNIARFSACAATAALLCACVNKPPAAPVQLRVIAFNDFHGNLESAGANGGAPLTLAFDDPREPGKPLRVAVGGAHALAGTVRALRAGAPHSVVLSSGDMFGASPLASTLFRHESTIEAMNLVGVDIAAAGNHEFDAGAAELQRLVNGGCATNSPELAVRSCALRPYAGAKFTLLTANVETTPARSLFPAYTVRQYGPIKVGFIGAVTRTTPSIVVPSGVAGLSFVDEADAINRAAAALKEQGVNTVIVTIHEGGETGQSGQPADWNDESCPNARGDIFPILKRMSAAVDLVLSAHTHQGYRCIVDGRPVLQAVSYGRGVSVADLTIDAVTGRVDAARTLSRNLPVFNERSDPAVREVLTNALPATYAQALRAAVPAADVAQIVAEYSRAAAPIAQREVGRIAGGFDRTGNADTTAGRLIADAQLAATREPSRGGAQIALMNPGGVRTDLVCRGTPPCPVTYGDVFTMQPFGNSMVVMSLTGAELRNLLEAQQRPGRPAPTMLSPSAGLTYRWVASAANGQRVQDLRLEGQPVRPDTEYRVAVNSFLAEGGDGFVGLKSGRRRVGGSQDLDAMLDYLREPRAPVAQPRITWVP